MVISLSQSNEQIGWSSLTMFLRAVPLLIGILHVTELVDFDAIVAELWYWIAAQGWCTSAMSEANVAASSFFSWIVWFRALDSVSFLHVFRFVQRPPKAVGSFISESYSAFCSMQCPSMRDLRLMRVWGSLPVYLLAVALLHCVKTPRPVEMQPPTFVRLVAEVGLGIWAYDFIFYWIHLLMHRFPHAPHGHMVHHEVSTANGKCHTKFLEAELVVNHSLMDGALQVGVNIVVQNLCLWGGPKHKLCRYLHNVLVTYLLTEAHSGLDLPWASHRVFPEIFGGAVRHEIHHHIHKCCFHQFFKYLDDLFGYGPPDHAIEKIPKNVGAQLNQGEPIPRLS
jgi:cholesterol 25-hydroxylase